MVHSRTVKLSCVGFFVLVGAFTWSSGEPIFNEGEVGFYRGLSVEIMGVIDSEVVREANKQRFFLRVEEVEVRAADAVAEGRAVSRRRKVSGKVAVDAPRFPELEFGEQVSVHGVLQELPEDRFSYKKYLEKEGVSAVMKVRGVRSLGKEWRFDLRFWLMQARASLQERIDGLFGEPASGIVLGLLLGIRSTLSEQILADFQTTSLTHILAISGYNITLLINICSGMLGGAGRRERFFLTILSILCFAIITGLSASVVRASFMGALTVLAQFWGRKSSGVQAILISGAVMVALNPLILLWDISFQLSFLSTLGLLLLLPRWEHLFAKAGPFIGEALSVTLSATVFTTPIILYYFGRFSLISPLANIVFLPLVPVIMLLSFFGMVVSFLFWPMSILFVGLTWLTVFLLTQGVSVFAKIPFASIEIGSFPLPMVFLSYLLLALVLILHKPKRGRGFADCPAQLSVPPSRGK